MGSGQGVAGRMRGGGLRVLERGLCGRCAFCCKEPPSCFSASCDWPWGEDRDKVEFFRNCLNHNVKATFPLPVLTPNAEESKTMRP